MFSSQPLFGSTDQPVHGLAGQVLDSASMEAGQDWHPASNQTGTAPAAATIAAEAIAATASMCGSKSRQGQMGEGRWVIALVNGFGCVLMLGNN